MFSGNKVTTVTANNLKEERTMVRLKETVKKAMKNAKKHAAVAMAGVGMMLMNVQTYVYASGTDAVTKPLTNLKTLVISVIGAVGVIILAKNVMEFAQAYQQQDSSTMNSALKGIVAGAMMAGISSVLTFLGF